MAELDFQISCPLPLDRYPKILLAHGGGGRLMHQLIEQLIAPALAGPAYQGGHDAAVIDVSQGRWAFTTDSFVIRPLFFPGGDIGRLAVFGTVNDLAMAGARPRYLSLSLILEEGLPTETLWRLMTSVRRAADEAGVRVITGDTKVVEKGKGDGLFINTAGWGEVPTNVEIHPRRVVPGDLVLISGDVGRHGIAVTVQREGLEFEAPVESDLADVSPAVQALVVAGVDVHCLRDLTRGGLASAVNEIAATAGVSVELEESKIPVHPIVRAACELLGFDPFYVANEGRFVAFVSAAEAERALHLLAGVPVSAGSVSCGRVLPKGEAPVVVRNALGTRRVLDVLSGEQLPRIC